MKTILKLGLAATTLALASIASVNAQTNDAYIGEMRIMPITFCPRSWAEADGRLLPIASYTALYSLYGTQFGGDGRVTFGLPDMRGRLAVGIGQHPGSSYSYTQGQRFGVDEVTLTTLTMPIHSHRIQGSLVAPDTGSLDGHGWGEFPTGAPADTYNTGGSLNETARPDLIGANGGSFPHNNIAPSLVLRHCVALTGLYPSRG